MVDLIFQGLKFNLSPFWLKFQSCSVKYYMSLTLVHVKYWIHRRSMSVLSLGPNQESSTLQAACFYFSHLYHLQNTWEQRSNMTYAVILLDLAIVNNGYLFHRLKFNHFLTTSPSSTIPTAPVLQGYTYPCYVQSIILPSFICPSGPHSPPNFRSIPQPNCILY